MTNKAISSCGGVTLDDFTESNQTGRFRRSSIGRDLFGNPKRKTWGYYITAPGGLVQRPPDGKKSFLYLLLQDDRCNDHYSVTQGVTDVVDLTIKISDQSSAAKRRARAQGKAKDKGKKPKHGPASSRIGVEMYWNSPEAKKLFVGNSSDGSNVVKFLEERIEQFRQANRTIN